MVEPTEQFTRIADALALAGLDKVQITHQARCISAEITHLFRGVIYPLSIIALPRHFDVHDHRSLHLLLAREFGLTDQSLAILLSAEEKKLHVRRPWVMETLVSFQNGLRHGGEKYLREFILTNFPSMLLSPYQSARPVNERMFFGRDDDIVDLCGDGDNYIVVGPRRGGKTSLAQQVERRLRTDAAFRVSMGKGVGSDRYLYSVSYIDVQGLVKLDDLWMEILRRMGLEERDFKGGISKKLAFWTRDPITKDPFELLRHLLRYKYKRCVLLLDEVDYWLKTDEASGWPIFGKLRVLADDVNARAKVIVLGYEHLFSASKNRAFPLHGRFQVKRIANLERKGVVELIETPLREIGVEFEDLPQIALLVDKATGGMPNLVQDVCKALVSQIDNREKRKINPRMVADLLDKERATLIRSVYQSFNELDNNLARLVAYAAAGMDEVRVLEMLNRLRREYHIDVNDQSVRGVFDYLYLHNVLHTSGKQEFIFASDLLEGRLKDDLQNEAEAATLLETLINAARRRHGSLI